MYDFLTSTKGAGNALVMEKTFDEQVQEARGKFPPQACQCRKSEATPEQWAAHLDYRKGYTKTEGHRARRAARKECKTYRKRHPEKAKAMAKVQASRRKGKAAAWRRDYRKRKDNDRIAAMNRRRSMTAEQKALRNDKMAEYLRRRSKEDRQFAASRSIRCRIYNCLKKGWKSGSTVELLGCSVEQCLARIESQFTAGMSWANWGQGRDNSTWHIDHIIPVTAFDTDTAEGQKLAFHHTNLQPMWGSDNIKKGGAKRV
jgi:hypothetical protein